MYAISIEYEDTSLFKQGDKPKKKQNKIYYNKMGE